MIRRLLPVLAIAGLLGACSSGTANAPDPGSPTMSRGGDDRRDDDRDGGRRGRGRGRDNERRGAMGGPVENAALRGITLSDEQRRKVQAIRESYRTQMQDMRRREQGETSRPGSTALVEKQQAEIRAVLTAEQQAQFDRNVAEMRARMEQRGGGRRRG